ncbi:hypothetical protein T265_09400 [Opisthorchis viverrini]|uniref:RRM domain-containing protein n=1 Tax=Opisthorchis viverrini TaxID=6198 RepID=A0A074ZH23_OPIVI|nr:hypothetical protein T265_09400 [Opisthorchis viverrini]KER22535.1 hypothetical protein T265_09400 [Opisthorchis viverrini]
MWETFVSDRLAVAQDGETSLSVLSDEDKAEVDLRSVYVGNVDYGATADELEAHFRACGPINRVTILCNKYTGQPKGFAYIEFDTRDAVEAAMALDESNFRNRALKVLPKRTNVPGMSMTNRPPYMRGGRGRGRGMPFGLRPAYYGGGRMRFPRSRSFTVFAPTILPTTPSDTGILACLCGSLTYLLDRVRAPSAGPAPTCPVVTPM